MPEHFSPIQNVEPSRSPEQKRAQLLSKLRQINLEEHKRFGAPFVTEEDLILACAKSFCNAHILSLLSDKLAKEAERKYRDMAKRRLTPETRELLKGSIETVLHFENKIFLTTYTAIAEKIVGEIKAHFPELVESKRFQPRKSIRT